MWPLSALCPERLIGVVFVLGIHFTKGDDSEEANLGFNNGFAAVRRAFEPFGVLKDGECPTAVPCHLLAGPLRAIRALLNEIDTVSNDHCQRPQGSETGTPLYPQIFQPPQQVSSYAAGLGNFPPLPQYQQASPFMQLRNNPTTLKTHRMALDQTVSSLDHHAFNPLVFETDQRKKKKPCHSRRSGKNKHKNAAASARMQEVAAAVEEPARDQPPFSTTEATESNVSLPTSTESVGNEA